MTTTTTLTTPTLDPITRLNKDLREAAVTLSPQEARYMVDAYYTIQDYRKATANQIRAMGTAEQPEPHLLLDWYFQQNETLEGQIKKALGAWAEAQPVGKWALSITGIGPVISAGLSAHIDISKAPTAGHLWSFAGLNPTQQWSKGEKRPWNSDLKTLCWKIGESFVKVCTNANDVYGKLYLERKEYEAKRNDAGELAEQAATKLEKFKIGKTTEAYGHYAAGKLPPAHIHARAKRWVVKLFLSHWHAVAYRYHHGVNAAKPYVFAHLGHVHEIEVPNWPF